MEIRSTRSRERGGVYWCVGGILAVLLLGCGADTADNEGPRSMIQTSAAVAVVPSTSGHAPTIDKILIRPARPSPGRSVQATASVSDLDGDPIEVVYRWRMRNGRVLGEGRIFDTTGLREGTRLEVVVTASDRDSASEPKIHVFRLAQSEAAIGLVVIDDSDGTQPGVTLKGVVEVSNAESGRLEIALEWTVNGSVVGTEEELDTTPFVPGDIVILRARVANNRLQDRPISSPAIRLSRGVGPKISSKPLAGIESGLFRYQIRATSTEPNARLVYSLISGPDGMTVHEMSGLVRWGPTSDQRGRFDVEVSATDQWGSGVAQSFAIVADAPAGSPASPR